MSSTKIFDDDLEKLEKTLEKGNKKFQTLFELTNSAKPTTTISKETKLKLIAEKYEATRKQEKAIKLIVEDEEKTKRVIELFRERRKILRAFKKRIEKEI